MKKLIDKELKKLGYQIAKYPGPDQRRRLLIVNQYQINLLFDVGANYGAYSLGMRKLGYKNRIVSFEPLNSAFNQLKNESASDPLWTIQNYALGNEAGKTKIHVSDNSFSSSILDILPEHLSSAPESRYVSEQDIEIKTLDSIYSEFVKEGDKMMLKIDTQGYEWNVLEGASKLLPKISMVQVEMSVFPLYQNEMLFSDLLRYLEDRNFKLCSLENGFSDPVSGKLLQVDGIFVRKELIK
jgi:FkbM family methyltransferase